MRNRHDKTNQNISWLSVERIAKAPLLLSLFLLASCVKFNNVSVESTSSTGTSTSSTPTANWCTDLGTITLDDRYTGGRNFLEYVNGSDTTASCDADNDTSCFHAALGRDIVLTGINSCDGISAEDSENAFIWYCDDSSGTATIELVHFQETKGIKDLIDSSSNVFKDMSVTITNSNESCSLQTTSSKWWTNTLADLPDNSTTALIALDGVDDGGNDEVYAAGTIFVVRANTSTNGYNLNRDQLGIVVLDGATLRYGGSNSNNTVWNGAPTPTNALSVQALVASDNDYLWLEGNFHGDPQGALDDDHVGYIFYTHTGAYGSTFRNITGQGSTQNSIYFANTRLTLVENIVNYNTTDDSEINDGVYVHYNAYYSKFINIKGYNLNGSALHVLNPHNTLIYRARSFNSTKALNFNGTSSNDSVIVDLANVNSYNGGFLGGNNNVAMFVTSIHGGGGFGHTIKSLQNSYIGSTVHGGGFGYSLTGTTANNTFSNIVSAHSAYYGFQMNGASVENNTFTDGFFVGNNAPNCLLTSHGANPGLTNAPTNCYKQGSSTATTSLNIDLSSSFVGNVALDVNTSEGGVLDYNDITTFTGFENEFRGWGNGENATMIHVSNRPPCNAGNTDCRLWDVSLSVNDVGNGGQPVLLNAHSCPAGTGSTVRTHTWSDASTTSFLKVAYERIYDGIGDDDGLCESNETCIFAPNIGAYQGHGDLVASSTTASGCADIGSGGTVENITLLQYETNGY